MGCVRVFGAGGSGCGTEQGSVDEEQGSVGDEVKSTANGRPGDVE